VTWHSSSVYRLLAILGCRLVCGLCCKPCGVAFISGSVFGVIPAVLASTSMKYDTPPRVYSRKNSVPFFFAGGVSHMLIGSIYRFVKMLRKAFERYMLNHVELSTHDEVTMLCM
jgi:peptidoglycan/LPS O-acetylase OafA/YrhL